MKTTIRALAFLAIGVWFVILCGCGGGGSNPISPAGEPEQDPNFTLSGDKNNVGDHIPLFVFELEFDRATKEITLIPDRNAIAHFNVTNLVRPPMCNDCLRIKVKSWDDGQKELLLSVYLKNPLPLLTGYDPRLILDTKIPGYIVADTETGLPDGYTTLWGDGIGDARNSFYAFLKNEASTQRACPPLSTITEEMLFHYVSDLNFSNVKVIIDASWPSNCAEPYGITGLQISDNPADVNASLDLSCNVNCWSGGWENIDFVRATIEKYGASEPYASVDLVHLADDEFTGSIDLAGQLPSGNYQLWIEAKSKSDVLSMWQMQDLVLTDSGNLHWAKSAGGASYYDSGLGITTLSDNSTVVTGKFRESATFGPGEPNQTVLISAGDDDIFVARYSRTAHSPGQKAPEEEGNMIGAMESRHFRTIRLSL